MSPTRAQLQCELGALVRDMRSVVATTYGAFFGANMGGRAHAFIEFNGLISKYVDICERCVEHGIDFRSANVHGGKPLPVEVHDMAYLGEKLACIFGPAIASNPEAARVLHKALFPDGAP